MFSIPFQLIEKFRKTYFIYFLQFLVWGSYMLFNRVHEPFEFIRSACMYIFLETGSVHSFQRILKGINNLKRESLPWVKLIYKRTEVVGEKNAPDDLWKMLRNKGLSWNNFP